MHASEKFARTHIRTRDQRSRVVSSVKVLENGVVAGDGDCKSLKPQARAVQRKRRTRIVLLDRHIEQ